MEYSENLRFAVSTIKDVLEKSGIPVVDIYLFGSRARGDYSSGSDWDFMISSTIDVPFTKKAQLTGRIQTILAEKNISVDIVIKSEEKIKKERDDVGIITYYALKDGVLI